MRRMRSRQARTNPVRAMAAVLLWFLCCGAVMACDAPGTQQPEGRKEPSVFLREPQPELIAQITQVMAEISKASPLPAEKATLVSDGVRGMSARNELRNANAHKLIRQLDAAAIPPIERLLTSQEDRTRLKAVNALFYLIRTRLDLATYCGATESALTKLFCRSTLDRTAEVRRWAIGGLYRLAFARHPEVPEEIRSALKSAENSDPDPELRKDAKYAQEDLGLAPRSPGREIIHD